jgi:hypothetical protein
MAPAERPLRRLWNDWHILCIKYETKLPIWILSKIQ